MTGGLNGTALNLYRAIISRTSQPDVQRELLVTLANRYGASSGDVTAVRQFLERDKTRESAG